MSAAPSPAPIPPWIDARLTAAFELAPIGIAHVSLDGGWLLVNRKLCEILGYSRVELLERRLQDLTHPEDLAVDLQHVSKLLAGEQETYTLDKRYIRKDGTIVWAKLTVSLVRDESSGVPLYFVWIVEDVSERKAVEAERERLETQFHHSQKMEAIGRLAGGVAHDFNNILTVITVNCELLLDELPAASPHRSDIDDIRQAAGRAASLTRQLLAFGRKQVLQPKPLNLNAVVAETARMLRRLIGEDIELVTIYDDTLGLITADPGQLQQVLVNLALNSRDAMPDGGVLIIETRQTSANLDAPHDHDAEVTTGGPYVVLEVTDTGHGMTEEIRARIFEPFFTTKEHGEGTGLGLATVYGIVEQSGGQIRVTSTPPCGTTFSIYLPQASGALEGRTLEAPVAMAGAGTETILVAEDEEALRSTTRRLLERQGYTVLEAPHPTEALRLIERHPGTIHLLLTDLIMPGMTGAELAEVITRLRPAMKVLFMSGYAKGAVLADGVLRRPGAFIQKPFTADELAKAVRNALAAAT